MNTFDEVILACHANQALKLVDNLYPKEEAILSPFKYEINTV